MENVNVWGSLALEGLVHFILQHELYVNTQKQRKRNMFGMYFSVQHSNVFLPECFVGGADVHILVKSHLMSVMI